MMSDLDAVEFADNPDPRCPCVLVLDTSGSMEGAPIAALNEGLLAFKKDIKGDELAQRRTEIALVTFGAGGVQILNHASGQMEPASAARQQAHTFVTAGEFQPSTLVADGLTPMGQAIHVGLNVLQERKETYRGNGISYYRPWMFLVSDGLPTDDWQGAAQRARGEAQHGGLVLFVVAVPPEADMNVLSQIATSDRPPAQLDNLKFADMFVWLSRSQQTVSRSKVGEQVPLPPISGWGLV
jgi:uncharacterized protein YegL